MKTLRDELNCFWEWASMTPEEYSLMPNSDEWEVDYPQWNQIYKLVSDELQKIISDPSMVDYCSILEAMAIDNEVENIMLLVEKDNTVAKKIIEKGYTFYQPQTRWQVAELIRRIGDTSSEFILEKMILSDNNKYVQRRALLALEAISKEKALIIAKIKMQDGDEKINKICKQILGL
jgi:hypothetical protein